MALETAFLSSGLPADAGVPTATAMAAAVRAHGAEPAFVGVLGGQPIVGVNEEGLERLARARRSRHGKSDRYTRSLMEHGTRSIERDLEWVDDLLAAERGSEPLTQEEATA